MRNIVLATTTAFVVALGTASAFAADGHGKPQTEAQQSGNNNQGAGVVNQGNVATAGAPTFLPMQPRTRMQPSPPVTSGMCNG